MTSRTFLDISRFFSKFWRSFSRFLKRFWFLFCFYSLWMQCLSSSYRDVWDVNRRWLRELRRSSRGTEHSWTRIDTAKSKHEKNTWRYLETRNPDFWWFLIQYFYFDSICNLLWVPFEFHEFQKNQHSFQVFKRGVCLNTFLKTLKTLNMVWNLDMAWQSQTDEADSLF